MRSGSLTGSVEPLNIRLPPGIDSQTAIIMLRADINLEKGLLKIYTFAQVEIISGLIHVPQALYRCSEAGADMLQVNQLFLPQCLEGYRSLTRVLRKVEEDPASAQDGLPIDQQVDDGGSVLRLLHIKGPLIAFQEDPVQLIFDCREVFTQEFSLIPARLIR